MRRKLSFLITLWWIILCGVLGVCMLLFAGKTPVVSVEENRTLSGMPAISLSTLKSGGISESFESFLTDRFFLRTELVDGANALKHLFSALTVDELLGAEGDEVFVPADEPAAQEEQQAAQAQPEEATQPEEDNQQVQIPTTATITGDSVNVWLNHRDGTRTALFTYSKEQIEKAATVLNQYAALLPVGGKLHVMLAPRAQTVNKFALHLDTESGWTSEVEAALQPLVSKNVVLHSAYDIFQEPILSGEYVYFRHYLLPPVNLFAF